MTNIKLNSTNRLVMLQFSFSNPKIIPDNVRRRQQETKAESDGRKQRSGGIIAIEPCENISIEEFVSDIERSGYTLVDGLYQSRQNVRHPSQMYHMVRFIFAHNEFVETNDDFIEIRPKIREELQHICETAFWRIRAFSNPFYKDGVEIPNFRALSFNFEARIPRFLPDGNPVVQRKKDAEGRKIGEPVPIEPTQRLVVASDTVELTN